VVDPSVRVPGLGAVAGAPPVRMDAVSLTLGIVGLPNVGKSTLFNALTRNDVLAANYPFATIEPNEGMVELPDKRLDRLAEIYSSERILPATVTFVDIAGIVKGASEGEGMGNAFLANIREADAICQVVRAFANDDVIHVDGRVDPAADISVIETELILADLQTIEKALPRLQKEGRKDRDKADEAVAAEQAQKILEDDRTLYSASVSGEFDPASVYDLHLMTAKPFLYVFNSDESVLTDEDRKAELRDLVAPADCVFLDAETESELLELDDDEAAELLASVGQDEPGLVTLAKAGFETLGLQTYLTAGPKESRAWTIPKGATAPQAAGVIHSDFERGFIKAEIVSFDDLDEYGSIAEARTHGKVRQEGKDYVMQDGDVVEFKFNV
jgi:GTP-binding protein YchF